MRSSWNARPGDMFNPPPQPKWRRHLQVAGLIVGPVVVALLLAGALLTMGASGA